MAEATVFSLSGIYEKDTFNPAAYLDMTKLSGTRFFCSDEAAVEFRKAAKTYGPEGIRLIDSGDYHYLSLFFLEQIQEPFLLLMLDHHSDMQESAFGADLLSCGSWMLTVLKTLPLCKKILLVGASEGGMDGQAAFPDRVVCVPEDEFSTLPEIMREFSDLPVYFSFDRDFLAVEDYKTDWSQGNMRLADTLPVLHDTLKNRRVLGIDLCGGETLTAAREDPDIAVKNRAADRNMLSFFEILLDKK